MPIRQSKDQASIRPASGRFGARLTSVAPWLVGLVLLAAVPYLPALDYPLLRDDRTLLENDWLHDQATIATVFGQHYWHGTRHEQSDLYRPLTILSLSWNLRATEAPSGLRAVNTAVHALTTLAVWWMLGCLFRRFASESIDGPSRHAAWAGAALFAVHPLASETVLFVTGRAEMLAALCGVSAFAVLIGSRDERHRRLRVASSSLLFAAALGFKESAASWVVILLVWSLVLRLSGQPTRAAVRGGVSWSVVFGAFVLLRGSVVGWLPGEPPWVDNPLVLEGGVTRVANATLLLARYVGKMLLPVRLSVEYGYEQIRIVPLLPWGLFGAVAVVVGGSVVALLLFRRSPLASFLWLFIPAAFAVTANVAVPIGTIFAERLAYLPLVGFCGLAAWLLWRLSVARRTVWVLLLLALVLGAARTVDRTGDFRDRAVFDQAAADASPRAVKALVNIGRTRLRQGRARDAIEPLERAVAIWPDYSAALSLLADVHTRLGDPVAAAHYHRRARRAFARWQSGEATPRKPE